MSRPLWIPRAEPRVKQPKRPYRHYGKRIRNKWTRQTGTIAEALWDGWHWDLGIMWDERPTDYFQPWNTAFFWRHNELIQ